MKHNPNEPASSRFWRLASLGLILISLVVITLESVPEIRAGREILFRQIENGFIAIFAVEYFLRAALAGRPWRYVLSFWGLVDLLAWLPALVFVSPQFVVLRALRVLRIFHLLRLPAFDAASKRLLLAMSRTKEALALFAILGFVTIFLAAVGIYVFEHEAQPEVFASIPHALWWAVVTLTTVGYGDAYPITLAGRLFTTAIVFIGLAIIAIPTGIVTAALLAADEELTVNNAETTKTKITTNSGESQ
ncbi:ion transporter [Cognatishimia sp. F0-27]|uniref:ion transporter n=1 Tax=Cognatishimia sp. F0-27 TaxID=2816855 RepID=UPI001D0C69C4|nr:ion transporter [Cognatishimia sp. F0-27]MCC1493923.1 ion transporter [Cognatishimia sp. F0-27]